MLDNKDILLLEKAKEEGKTLNEVIEGAKKIVELNKLQNKLQNIGEQIHYKFNIVVKNNIEKIAELENEEKILDFVIKESYNLYKKEQEEREKEELEIIE